METQLSIYDTQASPQQETDPRAEVETDDNQTNTVVRLVVGGSFYAILAIGLLLLRVTQRIDWAWIPVTAPLWAPFLLTTAIIVIFGLATLAMNTFSRER